MPCDTITTSGIILGSNIDPGLLTEALTALQLDPRTQGSRIYFRGGFYDTAAKQATFTQSRMAGTAGKEVEELTANIKREYGVAVLKSNAKRYGWQVKETGPYKYQVIKSTY